MGDKTGIAWTDATFNLWWGCTRVSAGCDNCYADAWARKFGFKLWDGGPRRFFGQKHWDEQLKWNAQVAASTGGASGTRVRKKVFCGSMCDVFEAAASAELDEPRERLWMLIEQTPNLDWLLLTKRPENMPTLAPRAWVGGWPANVWALTTIENQAVAAARLAAILRVPARIRGLSLEPLLGTVNFGRVDHLAYALAGH
jgi:protein gp37